MRINAYLEFDGQCQEAFKFYQSVLGGKITAMMPFEGSPARGMSRPDGAQRPCMLNSTLVTMS